MKLTRTTIKSLKPRSARYDERDDSLTGFLARVYPSGAITYFFQYRSPIHRRRVTYRIGSDGTINAVQARDIAEKLAGKVALGECPQSERLNVREEAKARKDITLGDFISTKYTPYAESHLQNANIDVLGRLKRNFGFLYGRELRDITAWAVESWRAKRLKDGLTKATVNRDINCLRGVLSKAVEWGHLEEHPLGKLKSIKVDKNRKPRFLSECERRLFMAALPTAPTYLQVMTRLALNTGLRRGELFHLQWNEIDFLNNTLTVIGEGAKNGQTRHIPLNREALSALSWWRTQTAPSALVFPGKNGQPFDNVKRSWASLIDAAGIEKFRFHDMRHDFASRLVMQGVPLNTVRELLGHESIETTLIYAHLAPDTKAKAVSLLD